jgi:hypothetical protein
MAAVLKPQHYRSRSHHSFWLIAATVLAFLLAVLCATPTM